MSVRKPFSGCQLSRDLCSSVRDLWKMLVSQVDPERSEEIKKRFGIAGQDEFNCSSEPLNRKFGGVVVFIKGRYGSVPQ